MSAALTIDSLKSILGREVDEIHLTVAKSSVLGLDPETIANTLGVTKQEIEDLMDLQEYKDIRLLVGAEQAKERVERDYGWDGLEHTALKKLGRRAELENDTDTLLRIAAVANRATRRTAPPKESVLDPSQAGTRVPLTLTRRFTEKLNASGQAIERTETQQISVLNGSAVNPTFKEVSSLLHGVTNSNAEGNEPVNQPKSLSESLNFDDRQVVKQLMAQPNTQRESAAPDDLSFESLKEMARRFKHG